MSQNRFDHLAVVVVDSNPDVSLVLSEYFSRAGARVEVCHSMKEASKVIHQLAPNLIISAVAGEDKDGSQFLRDLAALNLTNGRQAQVIAMTEMGRRKLRRELSEAGLSAVLCKPFTPGDLQEAMASLSLPVAGKN